MGWNFSDDKPIFLQIVTEISNSIVNGKYKPGDKLPAVREFAVMAGVNPNTMQRALAEVEQNGLIITKRGDGRYVTTNAEKIKDMGKIRLAQASDDFISAMIELGFTKAEILSQMQNRLKEESWWKL